SAPASRRCWSLPSAGGPGAASPPDCCGPTTPPSSSSAPPCRCRTMTTPLKGPRIEPRGGRASGLVVLLHGYGANGDDLIALGDGWRRSLPDAAFVAPNAPQSIPGMYGGLQ